MTTIPFTDSRWHALTAAHTLSGKFNSDGTSLTANTTGGTDWWRTADRHSQDGPTWGFEREVGEGFEVSVDLRVEPVVQYDQAALFLWVSPTQWIKTGVEFDNGALWNGAVVCNPYSDWSISKRRPSDSSRFTISVQPGGKELSIWHGDDMIREIKWFGPEASPGAQKMFIGVMACSPKEGGAEIAFEGFSVREGVRG